MESPSLDIKLLHLIVVSFLAFMLSACTVGEREKYSVSDQPPEGFGNPGFVCERTYWCADIKGSISAKEITIEEKGSFSKVSIGLPKGHEIKNALEVNGTILAEEILVEAEIADYVFSPSYDLQSLEFIEAFIKEHQHLPGIPSKSIIKNTGGKIPVGDYYQKLLEKVEELTLHVIKQNKRIVELEKTLAQQHEQIVSTSEDQ